MKRGIGELWHRRITRTAGANPHAAVRLEDVSRAVQMMFRAGGGDARVRVVPATPQRIGGPRASLGALDGETLALPPVLAVFDQPPWPRSSGCDRLTCLTWPEGVRKTGPGCPRASALPADRATAILRHRSDH